jgi:hypothetical protein
MAITPAQQDKIDKIKKKEFSLKLQIRGLKDTEWELPPKDRPANQAQIKALEAQLDTIPKQIDDVKNAAVYKKAGKDSTGKTILASNAPAYLSDDVVADLIAGGVNVGEAGAWQASGLGNISLVYTGEKAGETFTRFAPSGTGVGKKKISTGTTSAPDLKEVNALSSSIWTDSALQNKIISAYASKGQTISKVQASVVWQELVSTAAKIYAGGRGPKITPMDLLADQMSTMKGDEAALPTRQISKIDPIIIKDFVSGIYEKTLGRTATEAEKNEWYVKLKPSIETGVVTETKKIKNKKTGKMENVVITDPTKGFNQEAAGINIEQKLKEANPDDYDRKKRIEFSDWLSQNMGGA